MDEQLQRRLLTALERPHRLGMIGGDLADHVAHAASFGEVVAQLVGQDEVSPRRATDLGTGGGLPGVVLASLFPHWDWTLVDVRSARAQEVAAVISRLGLDANCQVIAQAAQELGRGDPWRASFDVVVARAFGPPPILAECAAGLLRVDGTLVVSEPPTSDTADRWPPGSLAQLGMGSPRIVTAGGSQFALIRKVAATDPRFPRVPPRSTRGWP